MIRKTIQLEKGDKVYVLSCGDIVDVILIEICTKKEARGRWIDGKTGQLMGRKKSMIRLRRDMVDGITTLAPKYWWGYGHYVYTRETAELAATWHIRWLRANLCDALWELRDRVDEMPLAQLGTLRRQLKLKSNFEQEK